MRIKKLFQFIINKKAFGLVLYAFLLFTHFIFKDHIFPISIFFYAAPLILIIGFGFLMLWLYCKHKIVAVTILLLQLGLGYYWFNHHYNVAIEKTIPAESKSVLFWNIAKNKNGFPFKTVNQKTNSKKIDLLTFVETDSLKPVDYAKLETQFKQYTFKKLEGNMLIGVNGKITSVIYKMKHERFKLNHIVLEIDAKKVAVLIVDINAYPFYSREKTIVNMLNYANKHEIDIIVGDFNTPFESVHFKNFNKTYTSFHEFGNGFTATWPYNIPILELDQIWISKKRKPIYLEKEQNSHSDHKLLVAHFDPK